MKKSILAMFIMLGSIIMDASSTPRNTPSVTIEELDEQLKTEREHQKRLFAEQRRRDIATDDAKHNGLFAQMVRWFKGEKSTARKLTF